MKVLIDDKIPYLREAAEWLLGKDSLMFLPGDKFAGSPELSEADALIIRTRTRCNAGLLSGTHVGFIATATIGYDHIDTDYLRSAGISWTNCPGCNATSVAQYVRNAILRTIPTILENREQRIIVNGEPQACQSMVNGQWSMVSRRRVSQLTIGIVGYGHVGKAVCQALKAIGCKVLLNDPPLEEAPCRAPSDSPFVSLQTIAEQCDVITFHTPLTTTGRWPTFHLADEAFFASLQRHPLIINAARGGVVDEAALLRAHAEGKVSHMIIDTWEGEPLISHPLLEHADIATPHIAGYSADGKSNATRMALRSLCSHFGITIPDEQHFLRLTAPPELSPAPRPTGNPLADALALYDPLADSARLKANPQAFEHLRNHYPLRREQ